MLETKWKGEMGLPEPNRRLMSDVEFYVNGPHKAEHLSERPDDPPSCRLNQIQERLGHRDVDGWWINEGYPLSAWLMGDR